MKQAGLVTLQLFIPEDGGDIFLRNVGGFSTYYRMLYPRRHKSLLKM
jgi:hypothetical protein